VSEAPRIAAKPAAGTTSVGELNALAAIYGRAVERYEEAKAAGMTSTDGDDTKGRSVDDFRTDETSLPR
jgi:hypothetical protein